MTTAGAKDLALLTGRVSYGKASDGHVYPIAIDTSGNVQTDLGKDGDNADSVAAVTSNVLKVLARLYGFNGTTWDRLLTADLDSNLTSDSKGLVTLSQVAGKGTTNQCLPIKTDQALADAKSLDAAYHKLCVMPFPYLFNGTNWDRQRNNHEVTVLASAARTASTSSADQTNYNARGVMVNVRVTAITDTPSVTAKIEGKDTASTSYFTILESAAIAATGLTTLTVYPGITAAANVSASHIVPRLWRITVTNADSDPITYSLSANYVV